MQKLRAPTGAIRRIHASRRGDFGRVRLQAGDYGREAFGQIVVARDFGEALEARLDETTHVTRHRPARFVGLEQDDGSHRVVRIDDGTGERIVRAKLLVAADGTRSSVRDALGIAADEHDYLQTLFVARLRAERAPDGTAWERLDDDCPTALLPRGDRHYGLIHAVARADVAQVQALADADFLARVQRAFGCAPGGCSPSARAARTRRSGSSRDRSPRRARCWSATPRRHCIRLARKASTSVCAMR